MEKINFSVNINAPKEKVWNVLWNEVTYRKWTSVFSETSYAVTDWNEGSKVLFLDGQGQGMVSKIETKRPYEFMSIKHLGVVKDGVEDTDSKQVEPWKGAMENYFLEGDASTTALTVEMDITEDHKSYFSDTWPKALEKVKAIAESED